jgi:hypothetical protein
MEPVNLQPVIFDDDDGTETVVETVTSEESSEEREDDHTVPIERQEEANQAMLHDGYPDRKLDSSGLMLYFVNLAWQRITASLLNKYYYCRAAIYRRESFFKRNNFTAFIELCRNKRGEDPHAEDPDWEQVRQRVIRWGHLDRFQDFCDLEKNLSAWFETLIVLVALTPPQFAKEKKFGIKGSLAYTDPDSRQADHSAGYYGYVDYTFGSGSNFFGSVELKISKLTRIPLWYQMRSVLAQIVCWLGGTREMQVGLILSNQGFKLLFRREIGVINGIPVYEYFHCCFDGESDYHLNSMTGEAGRQNRERLMRIVYELVKSTAFNPRAAEEVAEPEVPVVYDGRITDSEPSVDGDLPKRRSQRLQNQGNRENRRSSGGENAATERFEEV